MEDKLLTIKNLTKKFPGVTALSDVSLDLLEGEIHALAGENGAGKSTLGSIIGGIYKPDRGKLCFDGNNVQLDSAAEAKRRGISVVQQHFSLFEELTVAENIFIGQEEEIGVKGMIHTEQIYDKTVKVLNRVGLEVEPGKKVGCLGPTETKLLEVAKAIITSPRILIMDEPTAALPETDTEKLLELLENIADTGTAVIYISHRLEEIFKICDRVTVLKDGKKMDTLSVSETNREQIVNLMVGRELGNIFPGKASSFAGDLLEIKEVFGEIIKNVSFKLKKGEILCLAGIQGQGQRELIRSIFGLEPIETGKIVVNGREVNITDPGSAMENKLSFIPHSRETEGLALIRSLRENMALPSLDKRKKTGFVQEKIEVAKIKEQVKRLDVKAESIEEKVIYLSGGNQQKIVLGKWFLTSPQILLLDEPTRGVDVGARAEIYKLLRDFASQEKGVLILSTDLIEVVGLCDRVLVMRQGEIVDEVTGKEITEERIISSAIG